MKNSSFAITAAAKNAYIFVGREWRYLVKIGTLPLGLQLLATLFIHLQRPDAMALEGFLWSFPASVAFAWFMFLEARLLLLGERIDRLPADKEYRQERAYALKLCIIVALLFNMAITAAFATLEWLFMSGASAQSLFAGAAFLFLTGGLFWGVRFSIVHILAAVNYPIRPFLRQTHGMEISFRLIGMGFLCVVPALFIFQMLLSLIAPDANAELSDIQILAVLCLSAPLSLTLVAVLNAAAAFALKDLLGGRAG